MLRRTFLKGLVVGAASLYGSANLAKDMFQDLEVAEIDEVVAKTPFDSIESAVFDDKGGVMYIGQHRYELSTVWDMSTAKYAPILLA